MTIKAQAKTIQEGWIYDAHPGWDPGKVQRYCVQDEEWQGIRLSMKGVPTVKKLEILLMYYERKTDPVVDKEAGWGAMRNGHERFQCQVDNYLGALRRGGQLDHLNMVRKFI